MANRETLFLITLLSSVALSAALKYQYFRFVQQWPPATCTDDDKPKCRGKNTAKFKIHGFWPSNYSKELQCTGSPFDESLIDKKQRKKLDHYWPDVLRGNNTEFWRYEWTKSGVCSEEKFKQKEYFDQALKHRKNRQYDLLKILVRDGLKPSKSKKRKLEVIQKAIQDKTGALPAIRCNYVRGKRPREQLHEIVLCFREDGVTLRNCFRSSCPAEFYWYPRRSSGFVSYLEGMNETIVDHLSLGKAVLVMVGYSAYFAGKRWYRRSDRTEEEDDTKKEEDAKEEDAKDEDAKKEE